jgi:hypothetical protein
MGVLVVVVLKCMVVLDLRQVVLAIRDRDMMVVAVLPHSVDLVVGVLVQSVVVQQPIMEQTEV